jgi:hypothetical protein
MYTLPAAGPSFIGHILVVVIAAVATLGANLFRKLARKNG